MNRMKGSSRAKRIIAAVVMVAVAFGFVFASPLNLEGPLGNARVYDRSFKSVANPTTADEGWIVRTFDNEVLLANESMVMNVGSGSLVQILNLTNAPEVYLLDGWVAVGLASGSAQIRTPSTLYSAQQGTVLVVASTSQAENAYIHTGYAQATDAITSTKTDVLAGSYVNATAAGFQTLAPTDETVARAQLPEIEVPQASEEPVVEEPAKQEETAQPVAELTPAFEIKPLEKTLSYAGYEATITAYIGKAYVKYPSFVTAQEIYTAAAAALAAYPADLQNVTIRVVEDGLAEITYPEAYGEREFDYAIMLLEKELPYYIASLFAPKAPEAPVQPQVEVEEEPAKVPAAPVEPTVEIVLKQSVQDVEVVAEPQAPAMEAAPAVEGTEESVQTETVSEPVEAPVEQPVFEVAETPVAKKASNFRIGAKIAVEYGLPFEDNQYKGLVQDEYFRLGFFMNNVNIAVDPYITIGDFTLGLHLAINTADVKSSFAFDTANGITGYVASVAKYVGRINYENDAVKLAIDRNHEFTFASPVAASFDRDFDTTARLAASFDGRVVESLEITAFMDDLEMTNKLNGKKQFAGLRIALDAGPVEFGISAAADIRNMDILGKQYGAELYPAVDVNVPFSIGNTNIDIVLGGATNITVGEAVDFNTLSYLAKLNVEVSHDLYYIGVGAAYNKGDHLNGTVNNSLVTVTKPFNGESVDALLSAGLNWGPVAIDASANVPFALNKENGGLLAYNEVLTRRGNTATITADTIKLKAKLAFGGFALDGGIMFDGFCGRLADLSKAVVNGQDKMDAIRGLQDPEIATYFVGMSYGIGGFEAHVKGNYMPVVNESVNTRTLVLSVGGSFTF